MKRILIILTVLCFAFVLFACGNGNTDTQTNLSTDTTNMLENEKIILNGTVDKVNESSIEITIADNQNASGTYQVNVSAETLIYDKYGNKISLNQIEIDNTVEVSFNGQVTKSLPPQVNAIIIQVK